MHSRSKTDGRQTTHYGNSQNKDCLTRLDCLKTVSHVQTCRRFVLDLNDDRWHNVSVTVDLLTALLTVDVTSASGREHRLMTLMTSAITSSGDESWSPVTSVISLGGAILTLLS